MQMIFHLGKPSLKKKKNWNKCYNRGGGPADKMLQFLKLCLKSISGHSESFWFKKILGENGGGTNT